MTITLVLGIALGFTVAWVNGANDVSKGIATLVGSGVTNLRTAVLWGTLWTGVGGIAGAFLARAMVEMFGRGLLTPAAHPTAAAALATIAGAVIWVAAATRKGLPVSTTHAIVGSLAGVATAAYGLAGVQWMALGGKVFLPLLLGPVISMVLTVVTLRAVKRLFPAVNKDCICVELLPASALAVANANVSQVVTVPSLHLSTCPSAQKQSAGITLGHLHWLTSGATSFARGLNDAPKMVALVLAAAGLAGPSGNNALFYFACVTLGMMAGSWINGRRVTRVLATGVTEMSDREGFIANLVTSALVGPGAALGLPMSTTHVASGAIMGVAAGHGRDVHWNTLRDMLLAWVVTVPVAAAAGTGIYYLITLLGLK
jgi:inorganic phosphate transporter, PiT family